jgi:Glycosyl hydrolases family 16
MLVFLLNMTASASQPSTSGLQVWLDASDNGTLTVNTNGQLLEWHDKSGNDHDATNNSPANSPRVISEAMEKRAVVRFRGREYLQLSGAIRYQPGPLTVFIVSQRLASQSSDRQWQRLVSSSDGSTTADDSHAPNICFLALPDGSPKPYPPRVEEQEFSDALPMTMVIGRSARGPVDFFDGDIAEILVYDRSFLSEDESSAVLEYLHDKWGTHMASEDNGWTRVGLLPNPPKRVNDTYPLSDQANKGHWEKIEELSDEFEGTSLDTNKWRLEYPGYKGRPPSKFSPENVTVSGGQLQLAMRKLSSTNLLDRIRYTSAIVGSRHLAYYGYYEVMARAMNSAGSSSFWFHNSETPREKNEIDVFEIGGKSPGFDRKLNMNLHVWETPAEKRHWNIGSSWIAPWRFADAFHVFGLEWNENEIKYYVDGVMVRRVKNTNWHNPLHMYFDSETMPTWFGLPADEDLPSTFSIKCVRAWHSQ